MNFFEAPLIVGIVFFITYKIIELFARRSERMAIIDKISDNMNPQLIENQLKSLGNFTRSSFTSLKAGCLLTGIGTGLLIGFIINSNSGANWEDKQLVIGACVLLCGGISLLISFIVELMISRKKE